MDKAEYLAQQKAEDRTISKSEYFAQRDSGLQSGITDISYIKNVMRGLVLEMQRLSNQMSFLYNIKEMKAGSGDKGMYFDRNGFWIGKEHWEDISTGVPEGTGIGVDGTFYGKDGITGTVSIPEGGGSFTVKNGLVTSL